MALDAPPAPAPEFAAIFRSQFSYVWNTLARLGIAARDLEDVAHDVFCQVHRQLPSFDARRPLRPWLFGFAFRIASDYRRLARHRFELIGLEVDRADKSRPADEQLVSAEERALVEAALRCVSLERRAVLMLHEIDGTPIPAVADALSLPVNTVYSRLRVARVELAAAVRRLQAEGKCHVQR